MRGFLQVSENSSNCTQNSIQYQTHPNPPHGCGEIHSKGYQLDMYVPVADLVAMEPALTLILAVALTVLCRGLGLFWAIVISILLCAFMDLDVSELSILAAMAVGAATLVRFAAPSEEA